MVVTSEEVEVVEITETEKRAAEFTEADGPVFMTIQFALDKEGAMTRKLVADLSLLPENEHEGARRYIKLVDSVLETANRIMGAEKVEMQEFHDGVEVKYEQA